MTLLRMRPRIGTPMKRKSAMSCQSKPMRVGGRTTRGAAPAAARRRSAPPMRSTARLRPPAKSPALNAGRMCSRMMRLAATSGIAPCSVAATWMSTSRSFLATVSSRPSPTSLRPSFQLDRDALRERGDVLGPRRRHDQDDDLRAALLLDRRELGAERLGLRRRERRRLVDDAAGEDRHRHQVLRLRGREDERGEQRRRGEDSAHRAPRDQRDAGLSKLTGGGTEICASLATVKLGLVL